MEDELTVQIDNSEAENAARDAQIAAENANMAAVAAASASVAQANLIGAVMEAGREDAQSAAISAEQAAHDAEVAATDAATTNVAVMAQFQRFHDTIIAEMELMRQEIATVKQNTPAPVVQEPEEEVQDIQPESTEESIEEENTASGNRRSRKGRMKRR